MGPKKIPFMQQPLEEVTRPPWVWIAMKVNIPNFGRLSGLEDMGGGENSIQIINFGSVSDKSFKEWRQK